MRNVLLVAPMPTHPSTTGASARVRYMAEALATLGHDTHFLHLQQPVRGPGPSLRGYWGDRLHVYRGLSPIGCVRRGRRKLVRITAKTLHLDLPVDSYFDPGCAPLVRDLLASRRFDAVIVSYVFYSRLLELVPDHAQKLIDTHDVFSGRFRLYREHGQASEFFSTGPAEEAKALRRADTVLAIQAWDATHFRSLSDSRVSVVGHLAPPAPEPRAAGPADSPVMLFVGGPMGINVHGVGWFIERVLPAVRRRVPGAELWLAGGIGDRIHGNPPGVRRLGFVDRLDEVYGRAAVVVNPQQFGTGLSIKSVDALRYGRPLVTTGSGARGLEAGAEIAFRRAESAEEFADLLVELLRDGAAGAALGARAGDFARRYYRTNLQALSDAVDGAERA